MGFIEPVTAVAAPPPPEPKSENSTLASERFMALAMSCVSSVPAEPTTVPAMIIAALSSTKPSKATARPVSALYSEMTTGMSAPPMGSVMAMPNSSASPKIIDTCSGSAPWCSTTMTPTASEPRNSRPLTNFWPPKRSVLLMTPCSLAQAIKLPLNEMAPMMPPTTASDMTTVL